MRQHPGRPFLRNSSFLSSLRHSGCPFLQNSSFLSSPRHPGRPFLQNSSFLSCEPESRGRSFDSPDFATTKNSAERWEGHGPGALSAKFFVLVLPATFWLSLPAKFFVVVLPATFWQTLPAKFFVLVLPLWRESVKGTDHLTHQMAQQRRILQRDEHGMMRALLPSEILRSCPPRDIPAVPSCEKLRCCPVNLSQGTGHLNRPMAQQRRILQGRSQEGSSWVLGSSSSLGYCT